MQVDIYFNLNKKCFSIKALGGPELGRVIERTGFAVLSNAEFIVQPKGRERVLREGRKNVHAFVRGEWLVGDYFAKKYAEYLRDRNCFTSRPIDYGHAAYDPYHAGNFNYYCERDGEELEIHGAGLVFCYLNENGKPRIAFKKRSGAWGPKFEFTGIDSGAAYHYMVMA